MEANTLVAGQDCGLLEQRVGDRERRARSHADPQHRVRGGVVEPVHGVGGRRQDRVEVLDHVVRRQAPLRPAEVHRAAGGHEPQPDGARALDLGGEQVATVGGEDVVVVHRRRASGLREPAEPGRRRGRDRLLVDAAPHRVEGGQPFEEGRVDGQAARHPLVEVVVRVDQARRDDAAAGVDAASALDVGGRSGPDRGHPAVLHDDVAVRILAPVTVHRHDGAAADDYALGHVRPCFPVAARRSRPAGGSSRRARPRRRCRAAARAPRGSRPPTGRPRG